MPAAAKARSATLAARLADLLLIGPSGLGDLAPSEAVRLRNGRLMMLISTVVMGTILLSFPLAAVPVWMWPVLVAVGAGSCALIIWLLVSVRPNSWQAVVVAVPTSLAVMGSCWIARGWFDQLPLLMTMLLSAHAIYLGWRSAAVVAVLGGLAISDVHESPADPLVRTAMLLGLAAIFEVTRRSEAMAIARVQSAEQRLRTTLDSLAEGVRILDPLLRHLYVNDAGARRTGKPREEILGRTLQELCPLSDAVDLTDRAAACLRGEGSQHFERQQVMPAGGTEWSDVTMERVPEGLYIMSRDITSEREAALAQSFAADVAERFRTGVATVPEAATAEAAAAVVCERLTSIPELTVVSVVLYLDDDEGVVIATRGPEDSPAQPGFRVPADRVREEVALGAGGPWVERIEALAERSPWQALIHGYGIRSRAHIPIRAGDRVVGLLAIGTRDEQFARVLAARLPGLSSIAAAADVLLAPRLERLRRDELERRALRTAIDAAAFQAVFAPVVDLTTQDVVGYEALTRFADGRPVRTVYARARELGMEAELRLAVVGQALAAARTLPVGPWLQVRVPSAMLRPGAPIVGLLAETTRPLVVDIVDDGVEDATAVRESVGGLGAVVRLAVDKAGVTQGTFDNILALRPAFVNLAQRLAQGCNHDLGRQALVTAMVRFVRSAGCRLVATGVTTRDEAQTLAGLGVDFARGPWFGNFMPAPPPRSVGRRGWPPYPGQPAPAGPD